MGKPRNRNGIESFEEVPMGVALLTYMGWGIIILIGYVKEFLMSFLPALNPEKNREVNFSMNPTFKTCCTAKLDCILFPGLCSFVCEF